jgi:hypothetical protein
MSTVNGTGKAALPRFPYRLRDLPLAARLTLSVFLLSVGLGYLSALVQLHFQHAKPGELMPDNDDLIRVFHGPTGGPPPSKIETLLEADADLPLNGSGQMRTPITGQNSMKDDVKERIKTMGRQRGVDAEVERWAKEQVAEEREGERQALLFWIRSGASKAEYDADKVCLTGDLATQPITDKYLTKDGDGKIEEPHAFKVKSMITDRCVRCHAESPARVQGNAKDFPLDSHERLQPYTTVKVESTAMSLPKLAQSTHAHLLTFAVLFCLTGLTFAFSGLPRLVRLLICPLPLLAQVVDIACWWLARMPGPEGVQFALAIRYTGMVVAGALAVQIIGGVLSMYRWKGKVVVLLLFAAACAVGAWLAPKALEFVAHEKDAAASAGP